MKGIERVAVIGAGTMGAGIAQVCAQAGYETHLADAFPGGLEKGRKAIEAFWAKGIEKGKTTPSQRDAWQANLTTTTDLATAASNADLVIEAVPEDMDLKRKVFAQLDAAAPRHAILATNTSSLSIRDIASATQRPHAVVGLHFFNPVPLMPLLEIVRHELCSPHTLEIAQGVGAKLGKTTITVRDSPGFATSRLGIALGNEAIRMLQEGVASARDIDTAMRLGYGHPMGPLELSDLVGLDVRHNISEYLYRKLGGEQFRSPALARDLVARGEFGKKTGKGIYDWSTGAPQERPRP